MLKDHKFFSVCGAPKAGTTALHRYLDAHPEVCMSDPKETDFFQHNYHRGWDWFESCFDPHGHERIFGEASPGNMIHPDAPARIAKHRPDARLIFVLRNPIERAYSQYYYGVMRGTDTSHKSFSALIRDSGDAWGRRVLELGMYHAQLQRFEQYFARDQLFVGLYEDLRADNKAFVRQILDFLAVDSSVGMLDVEAKVNETRYPRHTGLLRTAYAVWNPIKHLLPVTAVDAMFGLRSRIRDMFFQSGTQEKPPMGPDNRALLRNLYAEPNAQLEEWLGKDLSHWR